MTEVLIELIKPRTIFALMFYGAFIYMVIKGLPVPDALTGIVNILMGFYFGQRVRKGGENVDKG